MVYLAVSNANANANANQYCVHSHTAAAQARGMIDPEHAELLRIHYAVIICMHHGKNHPAGCGIFAMLPCQNI